MGQEEQVQVPVLIFTVICGDINDYNQITNAIRFALDNKRFNIIDFSVRTEQEIAKYIAESVCDSNVRAVVNIVGHGIENRICQIEYRALANSLKQYRNRIEFIFVSACCSNMAAELSEKLNCDVIYYSDNVLVGKAERAASVFYEEYSRHNNVESAVRKAQTEIVSLSLKQPPHRVTIASKNLLEGKIKLRVEGRKRKLRRGLLGKTLDNEETFPMPLLVRLFPRLFMKYKLRFRERAEGFVTAVVIIHIYFDFTRGELAVFREERGSSIFSIFLDSEEVANISGSRYQFLERVRSSIVVLRIILLIVSVLLAAFMMFLARLGVVVF